MTRVSVLLVGLGEAEAAALAADDAFAVASVSSIEERAGADAVVIALDGAPPLEAVRRARTVEPAAAVGVITDPSDAADGAVAHHAGRRTTSSAASCSPPVPADRARRRSQALNYGGTSEF